MQIYQTIKVAVPIYVLGCGIYGAIGGAMMRTFGKSMGPPPSLPFVMTCGFIFGSTVGPILFPYMLLNLLVY